MVNRGLDLMVVAVEDCERVIIILTHHTVYYTAPLQLATACF